jgi:hypothetical protein
MGAPIKPVQYESSHKSNKKNSWSSSRVISVVIYSVPTVIISLVSYVVFEYSILLPSLDPRIFESLIEVIGILLGFTVAGIFYYLGKIEDRKCDFIKSLSRRLNLVSRQNEQTRMRIDEIITNYTKIFEEMSDLIRSDLTYIIISYAIVISLSFFALFIDTSGIGIATVNLSKWSVVIVSVFGIIGTSHFFSRILRDFQNFSDKMFKKTIQNQANF